MNEPLIQLSNGENKRLQLAQSLLHHPSLLILDNPFTGLDIAGRKVLTEIINTISAEGIHVILITTPQEMPACITHVAVLDQGRLVFSGKKAKYHQQHLIKETRAILTKEELSKLNSRHTPPYDIVNKGKERKNTYTHIHHSVRYQTNVKK